MAKTKHTQGKLSWTPDGDSYAGTITAIEPNGKIRQVAVQSKDSSAEQWAADAAHIFLCCNSHDTLVEAAKALLSVIRDTATDQPNRAMRMVSITSGESEFTAIGNLRSALAAATK